MRNERVLFLFFSLVSFLVLMAVMLIQTRDFSFTLEMAPIIAVFVIVMMAGILHWGWRK